MALFKAFAPKVEVNGETVLSVVDGMAAFKNNALAILAKNGMANPKPGQWYPQQSWLDAFKEIAEKIGSSTLLMIGKSIPKNAKFPPAIDSIEKALAAIDVAYHMNHRNGEIGTYGYVKSGPRSAKMECRNPYPCEFDQGIIQSMAERFKPQGAAVVSVKHDPAACRKKGAASCIYHVSW